MTTETIKDLQKIHVAGWNEKDPAKRLELLRKIYAEDIKMYDTNFTLNGIVEISDFVGKLIAEDLNFSFEAAKDLDFLQNGARLFGKIVVGPDLNIIHSMDFFIIKNNKVAELYAFMDPQ